MKNEAQPILPGGGVIGVLGSGQLGRMLAFAAKQMGYRVFVYSPDSDSPAGQVAEREFVGAYEDVAAIQAFARQVDVITFEFENVPAEATTAAAKITPVRPSGSVLHVTQNRLREKSFLQEHGFPVTPFRSACTLADLQEAFQDLGPGVLKTASFGYDGKGQQRIQSEEELAEAWTRLAGAPAIYEAWAVFAKEISVVAARTISGDFRAFPVFENRHSRHILDLSFAPAEEPEAVHTEALRLAQGILEALDVVGLLTVEMFLCHDGKILVNELAPRTHNSGHLTIDACVTSQFEQQTRAICGLPLGDCSLLRPAAMVNLLGDLWEGGEPKWANALADPAVRLHLYGKTDPRPGRKMGHLSVLADTPEEALKRVRQARARLTD